MSTQPGQAADGLKRTITILFVLNILSYADRMIITMMVGPIRSDLGISDVEIAFLIGLAFAIFYTVCGVPMGFLADRISRRKLIFVGVIGWSAMTAYCGLASNFFELMIGRMGVGLGEAVLVPAAQSLISEKFGRERTTSALAIFTIGAVVGTGFATAVGGTLVHAALAHGDVVLPIIGTAHPWQLVFLALGALGICLAPTVFLIPDRHRQPVPKNSGWGFREIVRVIGGNKRFFLAFIGAQALINISVTGIATWAPEYAFRELGLTRADFSIPYGLMIIIFGIVGNLTAGAIIDRLIRKQVPNAHARYQLLVVSIAAPIMAFFLTIGNPIAFYLAIVAFYLGMAPYLSYGSAALQLATPASARGKVAAIFTLVNTLTAQTFGPLLIALFNDHLFGGERLGYAMALTVGVTVPLAIVCVLIAMGAKDRAAERDQGLDTGGAATAPLP